MEEDVNAERKMEIIKKVNKMIWDEKNIILEPKRGPNQCNVTKNIRFDVHIFKGTGSKNKMKRYMDTIPELKVVAQINDSKGFRQFIPFKSWADCWEKYKHTNYYKRYLYEMILSDKPCKPYLDIEWKYELYQEPDVFINRIKLDIIETFKIRYNKIITEDDFYITQAHKDKVKYSFHLTITTKDKLLVYKTNRKRENDSAWDLYIALVDKDKEYYENKIDGAVYSLDREMRCIYSTKFDQIRQLMPITNKGAWKNRRKMRLFFQAL